MNLSAQDARGPITTMRRGIGGFCRCKKALCFRVQEGDRAVRGNHWKFRHLRTPSRMR
jgi:hypothetical protein